MKNKLIFCSSLILLMWSCKKSTTTTDCSTVSVSYTSNIKPLVASKCATSGCHAAGSSDGDFTSYSGLYTKYKSGDLKKEVVTNKSMPKNGSLSTTELQQFECWIAAGAPEN